MTSEKLPPQSMLGGGHQTVTLRDVAEASGVSISTVSRVLDERIPPSKSAAAQRVRAAADALGYRRNLSASVLRRGRTGTVGVLVPRLSDAVMALLYEALERAAQARGLFTIVATSGDDPDQELRATESLLDRNVDGLVLASVQVEDQSPQLLRDRDVPHVLAIRTDGISPSSLGDDEVGGYLAVRHLLDLGHHDIGLAMGPLYASSARDRLAGARRALSEAGLAVRDDWVLTDGYRIEHGVAAGQRFFEGPNRDRPTAVFGANDTLALGVMAVAQRAGLRIGTDLALVGYNDTPIVEHLPTPLTSVRTPFDQIAASAFDLLLRPEEQPRIRRALPTLIPRASSGQPHR